MPQVDNGTVIFIVGFCAAWAAAVVLVVGLIATKVARTMVRQHQNPPEVHDFWRDM